MISLTQRSYTDDQLARAFVVSVYEPRGATFHPAPANKRASVNIDGLGVFLLQDPGHADFTVELMAAATDALIWTVDPQCADPESAARWRQTLSGVLARLHHLQYELAITAEED